MAHRLRALAALPDAQHLHGSSQLSVTLAAGEAEPQPLASAGKTSTHTKYKLGKPSKYKKSIAKAC